MACHLLNLPPELRLHIYAFIVAPTGSLYLHSTERARYAVSPKLDLALLATCHQVHAEARDVLFSANTVCLVVDAHETWPPISESQLPQQALERLENVQILLDCTRQLSGTYAADIDLAAFAVMKALKRLRLRVIAAVMRREEVVVAAGKSRDFPHFPALAAEILRRIPETAAVRYGRGRGLEERDAIPVEAIMMEARGRIRRGPPIYEAAEEHLFRSMAMVDVGRACAKNEAVGDVWDHWRYLGRAS